MKMLNLFIAIFLIPLINFGQSIERQVTSSTGNYSEAGDMQLSSTTGETVVKSTITGTLILTQGFQQPDEAGAVGIQEGQNLEIKYSIYPNPAKDILFIDLTSDKQTELVIQVFDIAGKEVGELGRKVDIFGTHKEKLNVKRLSTGYYFIRFKDVYNHTLESVKFEKVD